jgi:predicted nucleic acid-binding protein
VSVPAKIERSRYVLDSFALLAYLGGEAGEARVKAVLTDADRGLCETFLSIINYSEIIYIAEREQGLNAARKAIAAVDQLPITVLPADRELTFAAAHVKAQYPISYADAFAIAAAQQTGATILTGDPEFRNVEHLTHIEWLPSS